VGSDERSALPRTVNASMSLLRTQPTGRVAALLIALAVADAGRAVAAGPVLTLQEAVSRALREGSQARIARLEAEQADAALGQARSIYWPQAAVSSNAGWSNRQNDTIDAVDSLDPEQAQVKRYPLSSLGSNESWLSVYIDQVLIDLSRWHGVERSELEREAAGVQETQQREAISYAVTEQYLAVLRLQRLAAADTQRVSEAEWLDHQAATLYDSGRALAAEREQAALTLEEARVQAAARQAELEEARAALWLAIGGAPGEEPQFELAPESLPSGVAPSEPASDDVLSAVPELRILDLRKRMEEANLAAARAERYPTLALRGGYFHYGTKRFDSFESELAVGVDLRVPVFNGFKTSSAIAGASNALEAARLRYDAVRQNKRTRLRELARRLVSTQSQPQLAERRARLAAERRRLADLALQGQRGSLSEALATRAEADRTARAAIDADLDRVLLWAAFEREAGALTTALVGEQASATP
jgi:outer membrane protein TolC